VNVISFCSELSSQCALNSRIVFDNQNQAHTHSPAQDLFQANYPAKSLAIQCPSGSS
jgi:hypothetical protein